MLDPTRHRAIKMEKGVTPHFTRYTDELLSLASAPTLLELRLFPNAKELTESFSIFNAARAHLTDKEFGFDFSDPAVTVIAVGDGYTPRTAALFGFRTKWRCVSVDPLMTTPSEWEHKVQRLAVHRARFQDVHDEAALTGDRVLLVLPHAHISVGECIRRVRWRSAIAAVVIPCCDNYAISAATGPPMFEEEDGGVVSPHRLVRIWRWTRNHELPRRAAAAPRRQREGRLHPQSRLTKQSGRGKNCSASSAARACGPSSAVSRRSSKTRMRCTFVDIYTRCGVGGVPVGHGVGPRTHRVTHHCLVRTRTVQ